VTRVDQGQQGHKEKRTHRESPLFQGGLSLFCGVKLLSLQPMKTTHNGTYGRSADELTDPVLHGVASLADGDYHVSDS